MGKRSDAVPVRTCISCGAKRPKGELVRLALDPEGRAVEDERGTKPGRGAYVCRGGPCRERLTRPRWERAFRIRGGAGKKQGAVLEGKAGPPRSGVGNGKRNREG